MFSDFDTIVSINENNYGVVVEQNWHGTSHYTDKTYPIDCLVRKCQVLQKIALAELEKATAGYPQRGWYKNYTFIPAENWTEACRLARENGEIDYLM